MTVQLWYLFFAGFGALAGFGAILGLTAGVGRG